jgi:hypothetical protein
LTYRLPSSVASFVAVRTEAGRQVEGTVAVANALPAGWSESSMLSTSGKTIRHSGYTGTLPGIAAPGAGGPTPAMAIPMHAVPPGAMERRKATMGMGPGGGSASKEWHVIFGGPVLCVNGSALLYDSTQSRPEPPAPTTITGLRANMGNELSAWRQVDRRVELLIFVGDPALPRARVRLSDLLRHGERPLNLSCDENQLVRVELRDPNGVLATGSDELELAIRW